MVTAIILAAGFSKRFGDDKLLVKLRNKPIINYVVDTVINSNFQEIILVHRNQDIKKIVGTHNIKYIYNDISYKGMSTSLKCGLSIASTTDAFMFINGDQPLINKDIINKLIKVFDEQTESIIVPRYNGKRGNPVIFSSKWKEALMNVSGDIGGRNIIKNNPDEVYFIDISERICGIDIDTFEDYLTIKELLDK